MQNVVVQRVLGAARFDRESFLWMLWNDRATGDGAILVVGTDILLAIGLVGLSPLNLSFGTFEFLIRWVISGLFFWLLYAGIAYGIGRYVLEGSGQFSGVLRIVGFAYPTRLLILAFAQFVALLWAVLLGSIWFFAVVAHGTKEALELPIEKAVIAAVGGFAGYLIISTIFNF